MAHTLYHGGGPEMYGYYVQPVSGSPYYRCASGDDSIKHVGDFVARARTESNSAPFCANTYGQAAGNVKVGSAVLEEDPITGWAFCTSVVYADNTSGSYSAESQAQNVLDCQGGLCYQAMSSHNVWIINAWRDQFLFSPKHPDAGNCY